MVHPTTFQFDDDVFFAFRQKCNDEGVTMKERIQNFMRDYIKPKPSPKTTDLEIFKRIDQNIQTMTSDEMKKTQQELQELYRSTQDQSIRHQITLYATKIKTEYEKTRPATA